MKNLGELTLAAEKAMIPQFLDFVASHAKSVGYSAKRAEEIRAAVNEALQNIVDFICTEVGMEITLTCGDDRRRRFAVEVLDSGKSFNMLLEADPFLSGNDPSEKRPSVRLMKKIGDVEYKRFEGKNRLTITIYPEFGSPEWNAVKDDFPEEDLPQ
jgi:anti-sigma regulatory factor (Ser/Thr protein kinase)